MNAKRTPQAGDEVYNAEGELAMYVTTAKGGGYIVQPMFEDGDGVSEPRGHYVEGVTIWENVFLHPPRPMLDAAIAEQSERLAELRRNVLEATRERREALKDQQEVKARLQATEAMKYVDDYLAGKFTLFVCFPSYGVPTIEPAAVCLDHNDRYDKGQKLLTLFGDTKGNLQWCINQYKDSSGSWAEVLPISSEAEGIQKIRKRYEAAVAEWRALPADRKHHSEALAWAKLPRDWVQPPADVLDFIAAQTLAAATKRADELRAQLRDAEALIANAGGAA